MKQNIGFIDKGIRGILGLILIYIATKNYMTNEIISIISFVIGLILILTSMAGWCPIYRIFGITTKKDTTIV